MVETVTRTIDANGVMRPVYPDSDGEPMADNTLQFQWIVVLKENLEALFAERSDVFVAGDLLWYPVEGEPKIRLAPDALVAIGRPKGYRGSYKQWEENNIAPQVVFEVLSPGNRDSEMARKLAFYEHYSVEEYYLYDPDKRNLTAYLRPTPEQPFATTRVTDTLLSPRLTVRFDMTGGELVVYRPDGERFKTYTEIIAERDQALEERERERDARLVAEETAREFQARAHEAEERAERLTARLRELGIDP